MMFDLDSVKKTDKKKKSRIVIYIFGFLSMVIITVYSLLGNGIIEVNSDNTIPIIMYHNVVEKPVFKRLGYSIKTGRFDSHMKTLKKRGYTPILVSDLEENIYGDKKLPEKPIIVTFDDGKYNNYENAYPILRKYEIKANMFVIARNVESRTNINGSLSSDEYRGSFNADQMREMKSSGLIEFGSHTYSLHSKIDGVPLLIHKYKNDKDERRNIDTKISDLKKSKEIIEKVLNSKTSSIAYPYGGYDEDVLRIAESQGYKVGITTDIGAYKRGDNPYKIKRLNIDGLCSGHRLIAEIELIKFITKFRSIVR